MDIDTSKFAMHNINTKGFDKRHSETEGSVTTNEGQRTSGIPQKSQQHNLNRSEPMMTKVQHWSKHEQPRRRSLHHKLCANAEIIPD